MSKTEVAVETVKKEVFLKDLKHAISKGNEFKECLIEHHEKYLKHKEQLQEFHTDEEVVKTHQELVDILEFFD
jgi:hypothetical protein